MSDSIDDGRTDEDPIDEDREISDVGLPGPGDDTRTDGAAGRRPTEPPSTKLSRLRRAGPEAAVGPLGFSSCPTPP